MKLREDFMAALIVETDRKETDDGEQHGKQQDKDPISCHFRPTGHSSNSEIILFHKLNSNLWKTGGGIGKPIRKGIVECW